MSFELATGTFPVEAADCPGGLQMIMSTTGIKIMTADGSRTVHNIVYQSSTDQLARAEAGQQNERHGRREELTVQGGATMALLAQLERKGSGNRQPSAISPRRSCRGSCRLADRPCPGRAAATGRESARDGTPPRRGPAKHL